MDLVAATVTYGNRSELCEKVVKSVIDSGIARMVVVSNGCNGETLASLRRLERRFPEVKLIELPRNFGSAGGFSTALRYIDKNWPDVHILLLDDDNIVDFNSRAIEACGSPLAASHRECYVAFRPMERFQVRLKEGRKRVFPNPGSFLSVDIRSLAGRLLEHVEVARGEVSRTGDLTLPFAPYGGLILPPGATRIIGYPRADYVLYEDDTEFTWRLTRAGYQLKLFTDLEITDVDGKWNEVKGRQSVFSTPSHGRMYYAVRNRVNFDLKRAIEANAVGAFAVNALVFVAWHFVLAVRSRSVDSFALAMRAMWNGMAGRLGRERSVPSLDVFKLEV